MGKLDFSVLEINEDRTVYGLSEQSNDKTQSKDISSLSKRYLATARKGQGEVIPFFVVSRDYDKDTKDFQLFVGGLTECAGLDAFTIPKGAYVKAAIKPKLGFVWSLSIGEAKRSFYTEWISKSDYTPLNLEYEYHTEISKGKNPQIDIYFAVQKRT